MAGSPGSLSTAPEGRGGRQAQAREGREKLGAVIRRLSTLALAVGLAACSAHGHSAVRQVLCPGTHVPSASSTGDGLPAAASRTTDRHAVESLVQGMKRDLTSHFPKASVSVGPGGGFEWYRDAAGEVHTRQVTNYALHVHLGAGERCPAPVNQSFGGAEVRYLTNLT